MTEFLIPSIHTVGLRGSEPGVVGPGRKRNAGEVRSERSPISPPQYDQVPQRQGH